MIEEHSASGQSDVVLESIYVVYGMYMVVLWQDKDANVMSHYGQDSSIVEVRKEELGRGYFICVNNAFFSLEVYL